MNQAPPILIPAYEAELTVGDVVRRSSRFTREIVVVDDGSSDDTAGQASAAGAHVLQHPRNCGKGRALLTGFKFLFAQGHQNVITLDADGQHLPEEIPKLLQGCHGDTGLVIGSRAALFAAMHPVRRCSNTLSSALISAVAGERLEDVQSGFRLYTRRLLHETGFREAHFEAESAVVVRAIRRGLRVALVPIRLGCVDGRATSHYRPVVDSLRIALAVARARVDAGRPARP